MAKYADINTSGFVIAFYDDRIHTEIPSTAIQIDDATWEMLFSNPNGYVYDSSLGVFVPYTPPKDLEEYRSNKLKELDDTLEDHILSNYSRRKQRSDLKDKEFWIGWFTRFVVDANGNYVYTVDKIYQIGIDDGYAYWLQGVSMTDLINAHLTEMQNYQPSPQYTGDSTAWQNDYTMGWDQLVKIAVRIGFIRLCKLRYYSLRNSILSAASIEELDAIPMPPEGFPVLSPELVG